MPPTVSATPGDAAAAAVAGKRGFFGQAEGRHWRTIVAPRLELARQYRHRVMAQLVVVVQVLIAKRNPKHPLPTRVTTSCPIKSCCRTS
jgi:hypothetical protein